MAKSSADKLATLTVVVEYDELPADDDIRRIVEVAAEYGRVVTAHLVLLKDSEKDYVS